MEGKFQKAEAYGTNSDEQDEIIPTADESLVIEKIRAVWTSILKSDVASDTDFFGAGAGSMDVVRLVEEVKPLFL